MKRLLVLIDNMFVYDREVLKGIKARSEELSLKLHIWIDSIENADGILAKNWDYVIADYDKTDKHRVIPRLKGNIVLYSSHAILNPPMGVSTLVNDNNQFACLALGHFIRTGIKHVGFFSAKCDSDFGWASERNDFFRKNAQNVQVNYHEDVHEAIRKRAFPLGVYCSSDRSARTIAQYCFENGVSIPEQVSIIGTDCDLEESNISPVPLSSIDIEPFEIGRKCIDTLIKSERLSRPLHEIHEPKGLVNDISTESYGSSDDLVNKAMYFMHNYFYINIKVNEVAEYCRVSRKTLDNRFLATNEITVHQYLANLRLEKSKELLINSDESTENISLKCGYPSQSYFYQVFKKSVNCTPIEFRKQHS